MEARTTPLLLFILASNCTRIDIIQRHIDRRIALGTRLYVNEYTKRANKTRILEKIGSIRTKQYTNEAVYMNEQYTNEQTKQYANEQTKQES